MVCEIEGEYRVPEVPVYNKRIQEIERKYRILMPKMYLGPASSSEVKEIEKKLTDYNKDLEHKLTCMKSGHSIIHVRECIRRQTKELQEYIPCILTHELLPCLKRFLGTFGSACSYVKLIFHHVLAKLNHEARAYFEGSDDGFHLKCYFDLYYGGTNPKVSFDLINEVWKHHPSIEFKLRLLCCKRLFENKQYDILNHLIQNNDEYFVIVQKNIRPDQRCLDLEEYFIVLIILLCHYVTSRQTANIETVLMLVENVPPDLKLTHWNMLLTIRLQQTRLIPLLIKVLLNRPEFQYVSLEILSILNTMDAEEKMLKMSNLRSFLLMLILLMISSDSQHKSAKLKKYLALKYEYEDAILYLLWCSGDVEINPGPTLKRLKKTSDSVKKRNWIHDMCTTTLKILKSIELDSKSDGMWKEKPDIWKKLPGDKPFYDPRNKPKDKKYNIKTDEELLNCLLRCCAHPEKNITLPSNFQKEITAWKNDKLLLLELWIARQEIEAMRMAMGLLVTYSETPDLKRILKDCNVDLSFNSNSSQEKGPKAYSDIVRDLATTFCRISKDLPILEKKDGIWKTPPDDWNCWNTKDAYKDPCNTSKRHEKFQDQKLVNYLLDYCEKKEIPIPSELQLVVEAWKLGNRNDICKHYTIWSSMEIIQHSIKCLELEGLLEKPHVQKSLKQIGVSPHCEKVPNQLNNDSTVTTHNEGKVSGLPTNSLSNNLRDTNSSSSLYSTRDSDIDCSQHPYEAKALTNSHSTKSVIKCSKPDFQNHPSTSGCTIYSKKAPCQDNRVDLKSTDERLEFSDSHTILYEISNEETHFQSSTLSCTTYSKRAPCRENSGDLQFTDERLDIPDSQKCVSEILCQKPDFQPSSSGCSSFIKRPECLNVRENVPSTERIQKRRRPSSEERSDKRPRLHSGNEPQASTSSISRCYGVTIPSSHCDSDIADQCVNSTGYMEDSSDQSSNRITPPDNIQDTDSSKDDIFGLEDEIPQHLEEIIDRYIIMSCDNLEENLEENFGEDLEHIDRLFGEDLEHVDRLLKLWETL